MPTTASDGEFLELVKRRGSCRAFDRDRPVPREALRTCLTAGHLAPSACNRQPCHFVVVDDEQQRRALFENCRLPGIPHLWWSDVPVFVVLCVELSVLTHRVAPVMSGIAYYLLDAGIAGEHFVLAATEQGLGTCWIGWFRERAVKKLLGIPRSVRVVSLIAVGYPADELPTCGARSDLSSSVHWNCWAGDGASGSESR